MISLFSFGAILTSLILALIFCVVYSVFLKPILLLKYYTKQGALTEFYPLIGGYGKRMIEAPTTGDFMAKYRNILQQKTSDVRFFATNMGSGVLLILVDPSLIKEFLLKQEDYYIKADEYIDLYRPLVGSGIVTSEGKVWKKHRKIVSSAFHFEFIKDIVPVVVKTTEEMLEKLAASKDLENVNIMAQFQQITGEIVGRIFFGQQFSQYSFEGDNLTVALEKVGMPLVYETLGVWNNLFGPGFVKAGILPKHKKMLDKVRQIRELFRGMVEEAKKKKEKSGSQNREKNLLDLLLDHQQTDDQNQEGTLTTDEIIDEFLTLGIAGTDTTGHLLAIAVYYLTQHPEAQQKTLEEGLSLLNDSTGFTYERAEKMQYTLGVLKETLRLTNPAISLFFRRATKDHMLKDLKVKEGTMAVFFPNLNCFKEEYFDSPNNFLPERWNSQNEKEARWKKEPYAYIPFSAGPRNCIGQHLALLEGRIILGLFLKKFEMALPESYKMTFTARFLYEPLDPLILKLKPRK